VNSPGAGLAVAGACEVTSRVNISRCQHTLAKRNPATAVGMGWQFTESHATGKGSSPLASIPDANVKTTTGGKLDKQAPD
jgi:hypothetical protein